VVHELTHAVDDQWFGLDDDAADADEAFAIGALAEGSSTWVEERYTEQMTAADRAAAARQARREIDAMELPEFPLSVTEIGESVYSLGHLYVSGLIADGGIAALDAAFALPPMSTEQVLHPERSGVPARPREVAIPDVEGDIRSSGVLGEQQIVEVLNAELAPSVSRVAADGWAGDRYVVVESGDQVCVVIDIVADTPDDERQLRLAWMRWTARQADASVEDRPDGGLRIVVCHRAP
jgi:hypothetical protein